MMGLILLVEEEATCMVILRRTVEAEGHVAIKCSNGAQAWRVLTENRDAVDLVIADLVMPEVDGYGLLKRIRCDATMATLPVLVHTNYLGVRETHRVLELGASAVLPKPIDLDEIRAQIRYYMDNRAGYPFRPRVGSEDPADTLPRMRGVARTRAR